MNLDFNFLDQNVIVIVSYSLFSVNVDSICRINLDASEGMAHGYRHGEGFYFSEFPDVAMGYGDGLFMFKVLMGREYVGDSKTVPLGAYAKYQSRKILAKDRIIQGEEQEFGDCLIIKDNCQFIPYCVFKLAPIF